MWVLMDMINGAEALSAEKVNQIHGHVGGSQQYLGDPFLGTIYHFHSSCFNVNAFDVLNKK